MTPLAKKVFELFGKPELVSEAEHQQAKGQPSSRERTINQELADATPPPAALQVFPDWSALLVKSTVLGMSVWVVRDRRDGEDIARETGQPALLLDDVLRQQGKTATEARAALLPLLITGTAH
jgi:hypothetical protein